MKLVRWVLLGVFAAALCGVAFAPARAMLPPTAWLLDVRGPWWNGEASIDDNGAALGRLAWTFDFLALFAAEAALHWRFDNDGRRLEGRLVRGLSAIGLDAAGEVSSATVDHFATQDVDLSGVFVVEKLRLRAAGGSLAASGALRWSGGRVAYAAPGERRQVDLPAMRAMLHLQGEDAVLDVRTASARERLLEVRLQADGWLRARLTKRFLTLAGIPWPGTSANDEFVLAVAERCFVPPPAPVGQGLAALLEGEFVC